MIAGSTSISRPALALAVGPVAAGSAEEPRAPALFDPSDPRPMEART